MLLLVHKVASWILRRRMHQIERFIERPHEIQQAHFEQLIYKGRHTEWGRTYGYADIETVDQFRERVPINKYETLFPWIERSLKGEVDVLWPGKVEWFSKSS
ncbi:MAG: GH3 auxin-responsive promoter family protein, partial [Bacteroidota bacterium]